MNKPVDFPAAVDPIAALERHVRAEAEANRRLTAEVRRVRKAIETGVPLCDIEGRLDSEKNHGDG